MKACSSYLAQPLYGKSAWLSTTISLACFLFAIRLVKAICAGKIQNCFWFVDCVMIGCNCHESSEANTDYSSWL